MSFDSSRRGRVRGRRTLLRDLLAARTLRLLGSSNRLRCRPTPSPARLIGYLAELVGDGQGSQAGVCGAAAAVILASIDSRIVHRLAIQGHTRGSMSLLGTTSGKHQSGGGLPVGMLRDSRSAAGFSVIVMMSMTQQKSHNVDQTGVVLMSIHDLGKSQDGHPNVIAMVAPRQF